MTHRPPHALLRAAERYDIRLDLTDLAVMEALCGGRPPERVGLSGEAHVIEYRGRQMPVVYKRDVGRIVTVLPVHALSHTGGLKTQWTLP